MVARRGRKPKEVNEALRKEVFKRPEFLDKMPSKGQRSREIALLSEKLKHINNDECVVHSMVEFMERFMVKEGDVKKTCAYIKTQLKVVYDVRFPRVHIDNHMGKVYFWTVGIRKGTDNGNKS